MQGTSGLDLPTRVEQQLRELKKVDHDTFNEIISSFRSRDWTVALRCHFLLKRTEHSKLCMEVGRAAGFPSMVSKARHNPPL